MKASQSKSIHLALKQFMRDRKKTYADAAKVLGLSEASIKRLFSTAGLSLQRMEALCNWMGIDIKEVVLEADQQRSFITQLKPEQERALVKNPRLLLITYLLLNNWKEREIKEEFDYTDAELNKHFIKLDKMGFIELLPYNQIRLLTARNFEWSSNGPVRKFFNQKILPEYVNTNFSHPSEKLHFIGGMLSERSILKAHEKLEEVSRYFDQLIQEDLALPAKKRYGVAMMLSCRLFMFARMLGVKFNNPVKYRDLFQ